MTGHGYSWARREQLNAFNCGMLSCCKTGKSPNPAISYCRSPTAQFEIANGNSHQKPLYLGGFFRINSCLQLSCPVRNKDCPAYIGRRSLFSCPAYIDGGSSFSRPTSKHEVGPYPLWHQTDRLPHVCARDYIIIEGTLFVAVTKNKLQKILNQI